MKKLLSLTALCCVFALGAAHAADAPAAASAAAPGKQQTRMASCNSDAAGMKGEERKAFMKTCLSNKSTTQQDRMKSCNADAKGKKGDERKAFMSDCLKK